MPTRFSPTALRALRERRKLTQTQLAGVLGVSQRTVSAYELGEVDPGASTVAALADGLGTRPDALFEQTGSARRVARAGSRSSGP
jgi:transcriptional regulator with XRE-family HTH domain